MAYYNRWRPRWQNFRTRYVTRWRSSDRKASTNWVMIAVIVAVIGAGAWYAYSKFFKKPEKPQ